MTVHVDGRSVLMNGITQPAMPGQDELAIHGRADQEGLLASQVVAEADGVHACFAHIPSGLQGPFSHLGQEFFSEFGVRRQVHEEIGVVPQEVMNP